MAFEKIESARWVRVKFCADKIFELRETICFWLSDYGITKASKKIYRKIKSLRRVFISGRLTIKRLTRKKNKENECGMFILESEKQVGRKIKSSTGITDNNFHLSDSILDHKSIREWGWWSRIRNSTGVMLSAFRNLT